MNPRCGDCGGDVTTRAEGCGGYAAPSDLYADEGCCWAYEAWGDFQEVYYLFFYLTLLMVLVF